jgi:hypothetical protein
LEWGENFIQDHANYTFDDALPTPWGTQMWVQVEKKEKRRSRGTLPGSQHFEG